MDNTAHDPQDMTVSISHMPADVDEDTGLDGFEAAHTIRIRPQGTPEE